MPSTVTSPIRRWAVIDDAHVDISFLARQHRRRLSRTTQLALTAYRACNPDLDPVRSVFASRYGEYQRTFGILTELAAGEPASPAAFSVSVHNTPAGIAGIATANPAPSTTVAANAATIEAGFLEAAMQRSESGEDIVFVYVDEPLPDLYAAFRGGNDEAHAFGLRLAGDGERRIDLSWGVHGGADAWERGEDGIPGTGPALVRLLDAGTGCWRRFDGRLSWEWSVASP
jgi:hypothetical protein